MSDSTRAKHDEISGKNNSDGPNFPNGATFGVKRNVAIEFSRLETSEVAADSETIETKRIGNHLYWRSSAVPGSPWTPFA